MKLNFKHLLLTAIIAIVGLLSLDPNALAATMNLARYEVNKLPFTVAATSLSTTADYIPVFNAAKNQVVKVVVPMNFTTNSSTNLVTLSTTAALTFAANAGVTNVMSNAGVASTYTLPAATGTGKKIEVLVGAVNTSNYVITHAGSDKIYGALVFASDNASNAELGFETGGSGASTITLNGTTKGGAAVGDYLILQDIAAGVWVLRGQVTESGSETTPFS